MDQFGALRMELTRAVRIVVDTGVHLSGCTLQQAKDYAAANTGEPEDQIGLEVQRTIWPRVQPAYTIGEQEIVSMRDMTSKRLGEGVRPSGFRRRDAALGTSAAASDAASLKTVWTTGYVLRHYGRTRMQRLPILR
jgi:uncharacterized protein (DUF885 family)